MELYAKGQLSFLILTCLKERDFYGLDIISEISNKSNGRINLKKPSVYSNLTRMEKQKYISSYLQSSDFGPNRKYYSLTENGRRFYQELQEYFERNNIDVFSDFVDTDSPALNKEEVAQTQISEPENTNNDNDFFDFSSVSSTEDPAEVTEIKSDSEIIDQDTSNTDEANDFQFIPQNATLQESPTETSKPIEIEIEDSTNENVANKVENIKESQPSVNEYNKRLYDISKDINKFKRKRSFAEDQISMTATSPLADSQEKSKSNIENFKNSFLENKNKYQSERLDNLDFSRYRNKSPQEELKPDVEEVKNDAIFITQRFDAKDIERPKRIDPPKLKISVTESAKSTKLPAPKRDVSIDPSHKEILSKLYSRSKDSSVTETRDDYIYDYDDLKDYYKKQNIIFNEYKKPAEKLQHNTNKLYFLVSLFSFLIASGVSALLYFTLFKTNMLNVKTNFLFILLPGILIIDVIWKLCRLSKHKGWLPAQMMPQWQMWGIYLIVSGLIISLNFILGMTQNNFSLYATTTILPLVLSLLFFPTRYYLKRFILVKFWR